MIFGLFARASFGEIFSDDRLFVAEAPVVGEQSALDCAAAVVVSRIDAMSATALYKALVEAGTSEDTAKQAVEDLPSGGELATKSDLAQLEARLGADITQLETRLGADIAQLKIGIAQLEVHLVWRLLGGIAVLLGITAGVFKLVLG